ncbi:hypothetical protein LguiA_033633 [Lonicera macranthoides]
MFTTGKRVEVCLEKEDYRDVWFPALVLDSGNESFLVEYHSPGNTNKEGLVVVTVDHCNIRPTPPHLKDKKFGLLAKVDAFYDFGWWSGVITKELRDGRYIVFFKHSNKERKHSHSELRPHMEWKGGKWFTASQDISNPSSDHQGHTGKNNETTAATPCNGEASNSNPAEKYITKRTNPAETCHAFQNSYKKLKGCVVEKASSQSHNTTPLNRLGNNTINGGFASSIKINGDSEQTRVVGIQLSVKSGGLACRKKVSAQEVGGELGNQASNTVNKREREPESQTRVPQALARRKLQPSSSQASAGVEFCSSSQDRGVKYYVMQHEKIMGSNELEGFAEKTKKCLGSSILPAKSPEFSVEVEKQNGDVAAVEPMVKDCTNDDIRCSVIAASTEASIPNSQNVSSVGKAAEITEKDVSVKAAEMGRPSDWSDNQPFSMFIDGKQSPTTVDGPKCSIIRTVDECIERQKETGMKLTAVNDEGESQQDENQSIPFVKNTLLWKTIESMEVFQVMPQKPHFRNLCSFKETSREGLAIDRLTRLLLIKDKQEELEERSKEIKSRINEHDVETSNIDNEIDEIDERIKELQERRAVAVSKKEKRGSKIRSLELTAECIDDGMRSARLDFVSLAAAPW